MSRRLLPFVLFVAVLSACTTTRTTSLPGPTTTLEPTTTTEPPTTTTTTTTTTEPPTTTTTTTTEPPTTTTTTQPPATTTTSTTTTMPTEPPTTEPAATGTTSVPTTAPPTTVPAGTLTYRVFPGDTLFGIARAFNTTLAAIASVNDAAALAVIHDGDIVVLPPEARPITTADVDTVTYTVKAGDTIIAIAEAAGRTPAQLLALNDKLDDPNTLAIGEVLLIPVFD